MAAALFLTVQVFLRLIAERFGALVPEPMPVEIPASEVAGGLARLPRALEKHRPAIVIIELGGNDGLRGLPVRDIRTNLTELVKKSRASGARVLLVGVRMPPNYGPEYTRTFDAVFGEVAKSERVPLVPFLIADVALDDSLMQEDGIHPTAAAQPKLLGQVWPVLKPLLK